MIKLAAKERKIFGKALKTRLGGGQAAGDLPVVVYGPKDKPTPLFVDRKAFKKVLASGGESAMIGLEAADFQKDVLIHEIDFHPVSGEPRHADFLVVDKTKTVTVKVPLRFDGVAPAVKDLGGTLIKVLHELEVEVLPAEIPHEIAVDIAALATLEAQILVSDLKVPTGVKVLNEPEAVVASISVAEEEPEAPAEPVDLSKIEVEKKGKKEETADEAGDEKGKSAVETKSDEAK